MYLHLAKQSPGMCDRMATQGRSGWVKRGGSTKERATNEGTRDRGRIFTEANRDRDGPDDDASSKTRSGARWFFAFGFRPLAEVGSGARSRARGAPIRPCLPRTARGTCFSTCPAAVRGAGEGGVSVRGSAAGVPRSDASRVLGRGPRGAPGKRADARGESFAHLQVDVRALMQDLGERRVLLNQPPLPRAVFLHALAQGILLLRGPLRGEIGGGSGNASAPRKPEEIEGDVVEFRAGGRAPRVELGRRGADRATLAGDAPSSSGRP